MESLPNASIQPGTLEDASTHSEYRDITSKPRSKVWTKVAWFSRKAKNADLAVQHTSAGSFHTVHDYVDSTESDQLRSANHTWSSDDSLDVLSRDDRWLIETDANNLQAKRPLDLQLKGCVSRVRVVFTGEQQTKPNHTKTAADVGKDTNDNIKQSDKSNSDTTDYETELQDTFKDFSEACREFLNEGELSTADEDFISTDNVDGPHDSESPATANNQYSVSVQFDSTVYESEHTACSDAELSLPVTGTPVTNSEPPNPATTSEFIKESVLSQKTPSILSDHSALTIRRVSTPPHSAPLMRHHISVPLHSGSPNLGSLKNLSQCSSCNSIDAESLPGKLNELGHSCLIQRATSVPHNAYILGARVENNSAYERGISDYPLRVSSYSQLHCNSPEVVHIRQSSHPSQDLTKRLLEYTRDDNIPSPFYKQHKKGFGRKVSDPLTQVPELTVNRTFLEEYDGMVSRSEEDTGSTYSLQSIISNTQKRLETSEHGSLWSLRSRCSSVRSRTGSHCCDRLHPSYSKGVSGNVFKERMEKVLLWFNEFNDQQRNIMFTKLLGNCNCAQMHLLSVYMEPILHVGCPHNCEDFLSWLPPGLAFYILSYLDPVSLCRCSQVSFSWFNMANDPKLWMNLCRVDKWQLSPASQLKQLASYTLPDGRVQWKAMFTERYRLFSNWMKGRCTVRTFAGHTQGIMCIQFDDTRIVSGSSDKTIKVWNIRTNTPWAALTLAGHSGPVRCLHLYGNRLVSGSTDRTIKVWDLATDKVDWVGATCRATMVGHSHTVRCLQSDGEKVISGSYDHSLKVWDVKCGQCKVTLRGHTDAVLCLQFVGDTLVSGSSDQTIKVWSLPQGQCKMTLHGHQAAVTCVQFDQSRIISGSLDRFIKIWGINSGQCIRNLDWIKAEGHTGVIRQLQVDRWKMVSAADDRTLKVWSLDSGNRLVTLQSHTDGVTCLRFNDTTIVSGSYDKTVKLWDFSAC